MYASAAYPVRMDILKKGQASSPNGFIDVPEISLDCRTNNSELEKELFAIAKECFVLLGGQTEVQR